MHLTADEIIGASLPERAKLRNRLLDCVRNEKLFSLANLLTMLLSTEAIEYLKESDTGECQILR